MSERARWVSCAKGMDEGVSLNRHLLRPGRDTTLCNASASHADIWRGNTRKPMCEKCLTSKAGLKRGMPS